MTKVEPIDWSKFPKTTPDRTIYPKPGTKNFRQIEYVRISKSAKSGYVKKYKLQDKHLISEQIANRNHISSIKREL